MIHPSPPLPSQSTPKPPNDSLNPIQSNPIQPTIYLYTLLPHLPFPHHLPPFLHPVRPHPICHPIPVPILVVLLDPAPLFLVGGGVDVVGCDARGFVFDFLGEDEVEEDGEEGGYFIDGRGCVRFVSFYFDGVGG